MCIPYGHSLRATAFARRSRAVFIKLFDCTSVRNVFYTVTQYQYKHFIPAVKETIITLAICCTVWYSLYCFSTLFYCILYSCLTGLICSFGSLHPIFSSLCSWGEVPRGVWIWVSRYVHDSHCSPSGTQRHAIITCDPSVCFPSLLLLWLSGFANKLMGCPVKFLRQWRFFGIIMSYAIFGTYLH